MIWRRIFLSVLCLALLSVSPSHAESFTIDWSKLDNSLNQLEWNFQQLQADNQSLRKYSEEMERYSANQALQLQESEAKSQSSEKAMRRWKGYSLVITTVAISEGLVIYILSRGQ